MIKGKENLTRGTGLLEGFLAKKRADMANQLIPIELREGRLLDIGCGTYPYFLENTQFREKFGLDKVDDKNYPWSPSFSFVNFNLEQDHLLPFDDDYFEVVTLLAVLEHIEPDKVAGILRECHRILKKKGVLIITTPASWTERMLSNMSRLGLVSSEEIEEHKDTYNRPKMMSLLQHGGFYREKILVGYFEFFMNLWASATKV